MAKLGEQPGMVAAAERREGKLGQQVGAKPTRAAVQRRKEAIRKAKEEAERKKKELEKTQEELTGLSLSDYGAQYQELPDWQQEFFKKPSKVREEQAKEVEKIKAQVQDKIKDLQKRRQERRERYDRRVDSYREYAKRYAKKGDDERAERYRQRALKYKYEGYAEDEYYEEYIRGLKIGMSKLSVDQVIPYKDIRQYAKQRGEYEEAQKEQKYFGSGGSYQKAYESSLVSRGFVPSTFQEVGAETGKKEAYNPETGQYVTLGTYKVSPKDVSGLEPSELGKTTVQRSLDFGGKEFTLTAGKAQLYKGDEGELVTKYGGLGTTEQEVVESRIKELESQPAAKIDDVSLKKGLSEQFVESDVGRGLITAFSPRTAWALYTKGGQEFVSKTKPAIETGKEWIGKGMGWVDERVHWDFKDPLKDTSKIKFVGGFPTYQPIKLGKLEEPTRAEDILQTTREGLLTTHISRKEESLGQEKVDVLREEAQSKSQREYERGWSRDILMGEKTEEEAQKEFMESEVFKDIQEEYSKKLTKLEQDLPFKERVRGGVSLLPTTLGTKGLEIISSPTKLGLTAASFWGAGRVLKFVPKTLTTGALIGYGSSKVFSPTSSLEEVGMGTVLVGTGATLGAVQGFKYLRRPVVFRKAVGSSYLKSASKPKLPVGISKKYSIKFGGKQYSIDTTKFYEQETAKIFTPGSRAIVTTKGRLLLGKIGLKTKPLYGGIPTQQLPMSYNIEALGFKSFKTTFGGTSGYQKTLNRLTKYGYTPSQARAAIRLYYPKPQVQTLKTGGVVSVRGDDVFATSGRFEYLTEQPRVLVDKRLGIYSRRAAPKTDIFKINRRLGDFGDYNVRTDIAQYSPYKPLGKRTTYGYELSKVKVGDTKVGEMPIKMGETPTGIALSGRYYDLTSTFKRVQTLPFKRGAVKGTAETRIYEFGDKKRFFDLDRELLRKQGFYGEARSDFFINKAKIEKTPFWKTFGDSTAVSKPGVTKPPIVKNVQSSSVESVTSPTRSPSSWAGTGQYERTLGGVVPPQVGQPTVSFTTPRPVAGTTPTFTQQSMVGLSFTPATSIRTESKLTPTLKTRSLTKPAVKSRFKMGLEEVSKPRMKEGLRENLAQRMGLKTGLKNILATQMVLTPITPPIRPVTKPPIRRPPRVPIKPVPFLFGRKRRTTPVTKSTRTRSLFGVSRKPTLAAVGLNIRAPKLPSQRREATGLVVRPIIGMDKRKKKKRRTDDMWLV